MRKLIPLLEGWRFCKTEEIPCRWPDDWECVTLPHTWNAADGQDGGNDYWRGTATYARRLNRPEEQVCAFLQFDGAAMRAEVYLNGKKIFRHEGGYSTFRVEVTGLLEEENLLCVTVDNSVNDCIYPQKADFTFYGGLYRGVSLVLTPAEHFEVLKDGTPGMKITPRVEGACARVQVETWQNCEDPVTITAAGMTQTVSSANGYAKAEFIIDQPRLWDGLHDPFLYVAEATLPSGDAISLRFGCRTITFDPEKGFFLNGRSYPLRGVSRHQDRMGVGNALEAEMHREDFDIIREIGANTVRLAHYQQAQEVYDLCDEYGLLVWAEIPYITHHMPSGRDSTLAQMRELVTQCHHHPSIICWGLSNEISASGQVSEDLMENHLMLNDLCHRMDETRPTAMAHAFMLEIDHPLTRLADINGYNLYFGWYMGELQQNNDFLDRYHAAYPGYAMGFTEYGADANPAYQSAQPERGDYSETYQCVYHEHLLSCIEQRPWLWGTYVWNMFDFAADGRDEGGKHGQNQKGLVTFDRKLRKDAFYLYKAAWSNEPFVHLCGKRYTQRAGDETEVRIYSNQPQVTLIVDGIPVSEQTGKRVFSFRLPLRAKQKIEVCAGACSDSMTIYQVKEEPDVYRLPGRPPVVNWFDRETFDPTCYYLKDTLGVLWQHPEAGAIVNDVIARNRAKRGDVAKSAGHNANLQQMMASMTFEGILRQTGADAEEIKELNRQLQKIHRH